MSDANTGGVLCCDTDGCGHEDPAEKLTADLIGKPCPKCGASLLTAEDFKARQDMHSLFESLQDLVLLEICDYGDGDLRLSIQARKFGQN